MVQDFLNPQVFLKHGGSHGRPTKCPGNCRDSRDYIGSIYGLQGIYWAYIWIMENKMETTILYPQIKAGKDPPC